MSRKREISTDISQDARIADLSAFGHNAVAIYLMAIPQADDWGRLPGNPREFRMLVCPGFDETIADVDAVLSRIAELGLWDRYEVDGRQYIAFPPQTWFKRQSYINISKRFADTGSRFPANQQYRAYSETLLPENSKEQQGTAENSASPSLSPSPSVTPSVSPTPSVETPEESECSADAPTPDPEMDPPISKRFVRPTEREFAEFFKANGSTGKEAKVSWDYYQSNGWRVGKNPMRDWQAAARRWIAGCTVRGSPETLDDRIEATAADADAIIEKIKAQRNGAHGEAT